MTRRLRPRRLAFTLIEVAAAMAIAGVVAASALTVFALLNRRLTVVRAATVANDRAKVVIDDLVSQLQQAGGASVRPFMAVAVQNAPGATGTPLGVVPATPQDDRLLVAMAVPGVHECTITSAAPSGAPSTLPGVPLGSQQLVLTLEPSCCDQIGALDGQHTMMTVGSSHRQTFISSARVTIGGVTIDPRLGGVRPPGPITACVAFAEPGILASADTPAAPVAYAGGVLTRVEPRITYVDPDRQALMLAMDENVDGYLDDTEPRPVSAFTWAFEVMLGLDCDGDGRLNDRAEPNEWRFDGSDALPAGCTDATLRAIQVAVIAGNRVNDPGYLTEATIPPSRTERVGRQHLRSAIGRAIFRNALGATVLP